MSQPTYFIIAQPRGASSLLQQIIISNLEIGYVSNFLAKYHDNHKLGLIREKEILDASFKSTFLSEYGNTKGNCEPHEWGWFWQDMLNLKNKEHYSQNIDYKRLESALCDIAQFKGTPLIIDNIYAMSNIIKIKENIPNIKIINLTRNLYYVINSIINARISRYNDIKKFYGHPPQNIDAVLSIQNPIEQIVFQVKSIQNEIDLMLKKFKDTDILHIDYEDIYENSFSTVQEFHKFVMQDDINLKFKEKHLPQLTYRNDPSLINVQYKDDLDFYYKKYFGNRND